METCLSNIAFVPGRLRLARELRNKSQSDLAAALGATPAAVSQFEAGLSRPGSATLKRLAGELAVPEAFLTLPIDETHEGFFRSLRRTTVAARRRARAIAHLAHDAACHPATDGLFQALNLP